jgi:hypothetical protein
MAGGSKYNSNFFVVVNLQLTLQQLLAWGFCPSPHPTARASRLLHLVHDMLAHTLGPGDLAVLTYPTARSIILLALSQTIGLGCFHLLLFVWLRRPGCSRFALTEGE